MIDRRPVLIAGAGPVAMITALLLARHGVSSIMLEARTGLDGVGSKAICFQRDVLDIFDRIGIADQAVAEGVTWRVGRTYFRDQELFSTKLPDSGSGALPPFINLSQSALERYLLAAVRDQPLTEVRWGHRIVSLPVGARPTDDGVTVSAQTDRGRGTVDGAYLVGCDGGRSTVRDLIGAGFEGESFDEQFLIADIEADLPFPAERRFYFDPEWNPGRQVLVHPQPHGIWRIDWQVPADFDLEVERAGGGLDQRIRQITGDSRYRIDWISSYRFHQRLASTFRAGRVFLAGDAAHLMSPFGARGLNSGAQDAENLAWKLAWTIHGRGGPRLLDSYAAERVPAAEENLRVTSETMRFLIPQTPADADHRQAVLRAAVDDPNAARAVNSGRLAEPFLYANSPLTSPQTESTSTLVPGALCPDVVAEITGRPDVTRLREVFGSDVVVLTNAELARDALGDRAEVLMAPNALPALGVDQPTAMIVRPDGHIAAMTPPDRHAVMRALARSVGEPPG